MGWIAEARKRGVRVGARERAAPKVVVRNYSPNYSERAQVPLNLIVEHSTESHNRPGSIYDLAAIGHWFQRIEAQASAHVCTDGDGLSARYVSDVHKAWHCGAYNSASLGIEQIGIAAEGWRAWRARWRQLRETARWIAYWSERYRIPIRRARVSGGAVTRSGVITHAELGSLGGGHTDPGPFPFYRVLWLARAYKELRKRRR